jgi:hypothetical protein
VLAGAAALAACGADDGPAGPSGPLAARLSGPAPVAAAPNGGRTRCDYAVRWVSTWPHEAFRFVHTLTYRVGAGAPQTATPTPVCQ